MAFQAPPVGMPPQRQADERSALQKVVWFGILQLAGLVAGWVLGFYVFSTVFSNLGIYTLPQTPTPADVETILGPLFRGLSVLVPIMAIFQIVAIILLTLSFRQFCIVDRERFSLPSVLMLLMLAGAVIATVGIVPFFNSIPNIIAQAPSNAGAVPSEAFSSAIASLLVYVVFMLIGGLLGLIGLIGGQILGLWRVGSRYNETIVKVGAIFAIVPFLDVVAPILVIVGAYQAKGRVSLQS
ncbi:MAG TPA: DUF973 family protein [Nitrososphaerales archaeon]|nr:DUF973 family protein [Nitrososphaerales archaeon]